MHILGISAHYHDSAAVLIQDGITRCAVEEERFTRIKHDNGFPFHAISFCLKSAGIGMQDVDVVAYYEKPLLKFERILETFVETYPRSLRPFLKAVPEWLGDKIKVERTIRRKLAFRGKLFFVPHHYAHAAACFYPSGFAKAAILTLDGVGEYQTTGLWRGDGSKIAPIKSIDFPHSLGLLYSTFTSFLGFRVNDDEYKVMGLAAYGKPIHVNDIHRIIDVKDDGSFCMDMRYFSFRENFGMWSANFEKLFGAPRKPDEEILDRHRDLAASIQRVTEEIYFKILRHLYSLTKYESLCVGGGVALNAVANGKIYGKAPFKNVYILGPSGDSGAALGAALFSCHHLLDFAGRHKIENINLGPAYDDVRVENVLKNSGLAYEKFNTEGKLLYKTASLLAENEVVGWFQGKMEFGPRALGSRSILANPKPAYMKDKVNRIKRRESFRPFAGSILQEKVHEYFNVPEKLLCAPFMNFCFKVGENKKGELAAIVHSDGTCRIQTVNGNDGRYYKLIKAFQKLAGIPCLLNTSFNLRGEPIVENPEQAIADLLKTEMDHLVIGNFLVSKATRRE